MRFKVKTDTAMWMVVILYAVYAVISKDLIVVTGGIILLGFWMSKKDLYYEVNKNTLLIYRIFGRTEISLKDISTVSDPIPVIYKLNPRPGTISVYNQYNREIKICPVNKIDFAKAISKLNRKIKIEIKGY